MDVREHRLGCELIAPDWSLDLADDGRLSCRRGGQVVLPPGGIVRWADRPAPAITPDPPAVAAAGRDVLVAAGNRHMLATDDLALVVDDLAAPDRVRLGLLYPLLAPPLLRLHARTITLVSGEEAVSLVLVEPLGLRVRNEAGPTRLVLETTQRTRSVRIVSLLVPHRADRRPPLDLLRRPGRCGVRVAQGELWAAVDDGEPVELPWVGPVGLLDAAGTVLLDTTFCAGRNRG